ncbi:MAG: class I SAM-dependent methyltransferase [Microcoleaceae cyanobacterium]
MLIKKIHHKLVNQKSVKRLLTENRFFTRLYFNFLYIKQDPYHADGLSKQEELDHAFRILPDQPFSKGLEVGCGEGKNTWRLRAICDSVDAIDISVTAIRKARMHQPPATNFYTFDLVSDEFQKSYDFVFCADVLHYVSLRQMDDVARKLTDTTTVGGLIELVHVRSLSDDESGIALKEFGAKTIHQYFLKLDNLKLIQDESTPLYRITLFQRV